MRRREFILLLGGAGATWPLAARAQQPTMPVVGFLSIAAPDPYAHLVRAFNEGLSDAGYIEGRNVAIEYRWARGQPHLLPSLAVDLVSRQVDVIFASGGSQSAPAAKGATTKIPIVFVIAADPVALGLVESLNRPGTNLTGVNLLSAELVEKQFDLLNQLVPNNEMVALLVNPAAPYAKLEVESAQQAAHSRGRSVQIYRAASDDEIETAFTTLVQQRAGAILVAVDPFFNSRRERIVQLAVRHAIPGLYPTREFATAGGLASYGSSVSDAYRQAAVYAGKILKGAKPADLPVVQPTKIELIINQRVAKTLGLSVPPTLLAIADEVIE
jgi:putative ABC transport system substrate-binding protein